MAGSSGACFDFGSEDGFIWGVDPWAQAHACMLHMLSRQQHTPETQNPKPSAI